MPTRALVLIPITLIVESGVTAANPQLWTVLFDGERYLAPGGAWHGENLGCHGVPDSLGVSKVDRYPVLPRAAWLIAGGLRYER
jgi:hypothetical protein